jgi:SAM-dependent methyltransferase
VSPIAGNAVDHADASDESLDAFLARLIGGRVLDVATGDGSFIDYLVPRLASVESVVGIDSDPMRRSEFRSRFRDRRRAACRTMDARRITFPPASFDTASIAHSLCEFEAPQIVLDEILRVLRPGGRLVVCDSYRDQLDEPQRTFVVLHDWWCDVDAIDGRVHFPFRSRADLASLVARPGLDELHLFDVSDPSDNAFDAELLERLDDLVDRFMARAASVPELVDRGRALQRRMRRLGCQRPTALVAVGVRST